MPTTNTGHQCWECSRRRLVCDSARPSCRKCRARGNECPGYDHKPLKWMQPGQTKSKGARAATRLRTCDSPASAAMTAAPTTTRRSPVVAEKHEKRPAADHDEDMPMLIVNRHHESQPVLASQVRDRSTFGLFLRALEYYNVNIPPDLLGTGVGGETNPFFVPPAYAAYIPPVIAHNIICSALGHRILQTVAGGVFEEKRDAMAVAMQAHRGEAIRYLAGELRSPSDDTIQSILSLLLCEIQHSLSPNWWHHVDAAYTIINLHGGISKSIQTRPLLIKLYRYLFCADILGSTTSPVVTPSRARRQLELVDCLEELYGETLLTCIPCSTKLLAEIICINHHRSLRHSAAPLLPNGEQASTEEADIMARVLSFSSETWASGVCEWADSGPAVTAAGRGRLPVGSNPGTWDWARIGRIYQAAVALYCMASLPDSSDGYSSEIDLALALRDRLLRDLRQTSADTNGHLRKLVLWPLVILGLKLDPGDEEQEAARRYVISELEWESAALGTASPLVARDLLQRLWRSSRGGLGARWESLFDRPYVFGL